MENFMLFVVKNLIFKGLLWVCFCAFISRNTFHQANRIVILLIFAGGLLLPLVEVPLLKVNAETQNSIAYFWQFEHVTIIQDSESHPVKSINWQPFVLGIYLLGSLFLILRYAVGLMSVRKIIRNAHKIQVFNEKQIYVTSQNVSPFSWFRYVVLSEKDVQTDFQNILNHEMAHVQHRHSWDLLFVEVYGFFFWWNPFVWLLKKQLTAVHEFQADETALRQTSDKNQYRKELIIRCVGAKKVALAHNFETSNLKKRIYMTMKNQSTVNAKWSYVTLVFATMMTMFLFATETLRAQQKKENATTQKSNLEVVGQEANKEPKVIVIEGNPSKEALKQEMNSKRDDILVIIDGKKGEMSELNVMNPEIIDHISIFKGKEAEEVAKQYDVNAKEGVIILKTKSNVSTTPSNLSKNVSENDTTENPIVIFEGKEIEYEKLKGIAPESIESVEVLKGEKATKIYGEKGKNGVIIVTTKK